MMDIFSTPIADQDEVEKLLDELPVAVNKKSFANFVLGFPRNYLISTPRVEIVKHYFLMENLGGKMVVSFLSREHDLWKLHLVARDRYSLFARIAGTLSCFGMNIVSAQACSNTTSLVLDIFQFSDPDKRFENDTNRHKFRHFLEAVIEGKKELEPLLEERQQQMVPLTREPFTTTTDNTVHPSATYLALDCHNHFGLLYLVSSVIYQEGHDIEIAYIQTLGQQVHNEFYLTHQQKKLTSTMQKTLKVNLASLARHHFFAPGPETRPKRF